MKHSQEKIPELLKELEKLSIAERILLVEELWDSIACCNTDVPVPLWQKDELDIRKQEYLKNPNSGMEWNDVKQDILQTNPLQQ